MIEAQPIRPDELVSVLPKDAVKAILKPEEVTVAEAENEMRPDEMLISVTLGSDSRAYPIAVLSAHQIVNDVVAGRAIAVTW